MMLLAKAALGVGGTLVLAGAYTFHEGVLRIDVDEYRDGGSHVHLWLPAAVLPMAMHFAPRECLRDATRDAREVLPALHVAFKELKKFPNAELLEVQDGNKHIQLRTRDGKLQIDVASPEEIVHVHCPLATLDDVIRQIEASGPGA